MMDQKFLVLMLRTKSAHRALSAAWLEDKQERLHNLRTWHQDMKNRLHQARCDTAELPSKLIELESEIATLERLEIVPLDGTVREVKPCDRFAAESEAVTKPYRPSNGTEGDFFIEEQCGACTKADTCRIPQRTMLYDEDHLSYPKEWICEEDGQNPRCTAREVKP